MIIEIEEAVTAFMAAVRARDEAEEVLDAAQKAMAHARAAADDAVDRASDAGQELQRACILHARQLTMDDA